MRSLKSKFLSSESPAEFGSETVVPELQIGMGYSDSTQMGTTTFCVDTSNIVLHGKPTSSIGFSSSMDFDQTQSNLGVDVSAYVGVDRFSASIVASYAKSIQSNGYSLSYSFVFNVQLPSQILHVNKFGPEALNSFGVGVFSEANSTSGGLNLFDQVCGNKFIIQENSGAKLYTTLNVEFDSKYDKDKFSIGFKGNIADLANAVLQISDYATSHAISGSIKLTALQMGGDVMRLTEVFGNSQDNNVLKCQFDANDLANCKNVVNDIINYAKNDFANQIKYNETSGQIVGTPASTGVVYEKYKNIGIDEYHMGVDANIIAIRTFLGELDSEMNLLSTKLDKILYSGKISGLVDYSHPAVNHLWSAKWFWNPEYIDVEDKVQLKASYESANNIIKALHSPYSGPIQCYKYPDLCTKVNQTITNTMSTNLIDNSVIEMFSKAYQFSANCDGVSYGFRYLYPVGNNNYVEQTQYFSNTTLTKLPATEVVNIFNIDVTSTTNATGVTTYTAALSVNGNACQSISELNVNDIVPYFTSHSIADGDNLACLQAVCPVPVTAQSIVGVTFFEVDSPI